MEEFRVKKKYLLMLTTAVVAVTALIGGTMATKSDYSSSIIEKISERSLKVKTVSDIDDDIKIMPGGESEVSYKVKNVGGYDVYAKVYVIFDWEQNNKEAKIDKDEDMLSLYINTGNKKNANYVEIPKNGSDVYIGSYDEQIKVGDWIVTYYDNEQLQMYYTKPISSDSQSQDFLSMISCNSDMDNKYSKAKLNIETEVNAVQVNNEEDAIAAEWGVYPQFSVDSCNNKVINYISEDSK